MAMLIEFFFVLTLIVITIEGNQISLEQKLFFNQKINSYDKIYRKTAPGLVLPGTKWCGPGDVAENDDDLGSIIETDTCCRAHDLCDDILLPGQENHGLKNPDMFTRLNCKCDLAFHKCLHSTPTNKTVSDWMGTGYFFFRTTCFKKEYHIIDCEEYEEWNYTKRCLKYRFDRTRPKIYQWFDLPYYTSSKLSQVSKISSNNFYAELLEKQMALGIP